MKTKIIALLLVLVMSLTMFAACKGNGGGGGGGTTPGGGGGGDNPGGGGGGDNPDDTLDVYWTDKQSLIVEINTNSNNDEFPDACKRYLAGEGNYGADYGNLDTLVAQRNQIAEDKAKVDVLYSFPTESQDGGKTWGQNVNYFWDALDYDDSTRPDIFINYVYDVLAATLQGAFINLYTNTEVAKTTRGQGENYFTFGTDPNAKDTGDGYMYEYMRTLTVSKTTMYLIASDYFIDVIRAMFVVPVNNAELATLSNADVAGVEGAADVIRDRVGGDGFNIEDLYQMVRDHEWTYEALAVLCDLYDRDMDDTTGSRQTYTLKDKVGFAVSVSSGLSASGIVYTTPIEIVGREYYDVYPTSGPQYDEYKHDTALINNWKDFVYDYPEDSTPLLEFTAALQKLFETNGVITVKNGADDHANAFDTVKGDSLVAISQAFAQGNVLFGGAVLLGSLENEAYESMTGGENAGFGIVPVPLYKNPGINEETGEYNFGYMTQVHNLARIGAISRATKKFEACSAFLQWQSTHSSDILEKYYINKIQYGVAQGSEGNIEMIDLVRANVRSAFDKAMEDAIRVMFESKKNDLGNITIQAWHSVIQTNDFKAKDAIEKAFTEQVDTKVDMLLAIQSVYIEQENQDAAD